MLSTSAVTGQGVTQLISAIANHLVPIRPQVGQAIPFNKRQIEHLSDTLRLLQGQQADAARHKLNDLLSRTTISHDNA